MTKTVFIVCLVLLSLGCGIPTIPQVEDVKCTASRETVRQFYSQHFAAGDEMGFTVENVEKKQKFLTPELGQSLLTHLKTVTPAIGGDPFTASQEYPTGFKVGECAVGGDKNVTHTVQLFWSFWSEKDKPINRAIKVETELRDEKWLIKDITGDGEGLVKILGGGK